MRPPAKPPIGSYVVDTHTGKVGMVMGHEGPYVQLRALGGGKEWDVAPAATVTSHERAPSRHDRCGCQARAARGEEQEMRHPPAHVLAYARMGP